MGNFEEHMGYGIGAHIIISGLFVVMAQAALIPMYMAVIGVVSLPVTLAGAAFPDIDHPASKPNRMFRKLLTASGALLTAYLFGLFGFLAVYELFQSMGWTEVALPLTAVLTVGISIAGGFTTRFAFDRLRPPHRGMTHRLPVGVGVATGLGAVSWGVAALVGFAFPAAVALPIAGAFVGGVVSHLACDGVLLDRRTYTKLT